MTKRLPLFALALMLAVKTFAQTDSLKKHSLIRTMTDEEYSAWTSGKDLLNRSYVAELNHYPLPDDVLKYKKEMDLSPIQISKINDLIKTLKMKKAEVSVSVINNERVLDSLFRTKKADEGNIVFYSNRYGLYEGEYRTALLMACFGTRRLLTDQQLKKFEALQKHN